MTETTGRDSRPATGRNGAETPEVIAGELRKAFPGYEVTVRRDRDRNKPRYQLRARDGRNPTCLISHDPREIWDELKGA
jgi:hypothetical protein